MKALVFGCGYLGRRVATCWIDAGHHVSALTRSPSRAAELERMGIAPIVGDVTDTASLAKLPAVDVVLYAVGFDRASDATREQVVIDGLRNTLDAISGRADRLIFISTTSVYGQSQGEWIDEASPTQPASDAGRIAVEAERLLTRVFTSPLSLGRGAGGEGSRLTGDANRTTSEAESAGRGAPVAARHPLTPDPSPQGEGDRHGCSIPTFQGEGDRQDRGISSPQEEDERQRRGIHVSRRGAVVLRLSGLYGPGRLLRRAEQLQSGEPIAGDGDAWMNLIHVDDAASAVIAADRFLSTAATREQDALPTFLLSDDRPVRRRDYYGRLARLAGAPPPTFEPSSASRISGLGKRCRNARMKDRLAVTLQYPTYEQGLAAAWAAD